MPVLRYFGSQEDATVRCDTSQTGLGARLRKKCYSDWKEWEKEFAKTLARKLRVLRGLAAYCIHCSCNYERMVDFETDNSLWTQYIRTFYIQLQQYPRDCNGCYTIADVDVLIPPRLDTSKAKATFSSHPVYSYRAHLIQTQRDEEQQAEISSKQTNGN